jgi:branched-chain amino acid aminotransferase
MSAATGNDNRSYLFGDGLFETVRVEEGKPRFLEHHKRRFENSAAVLEFPRVSVEAGLRALDSLSGLEDGLWRVTVPRPNEETTESAEKVISKGHRNFPYQNAAPPRVKIVRDFYFPEYSLAEHKTTSWLRSLEARRLARRSGFDEALMVSPDGRLGEAAAANIFLYIAGRWVTPPVEGILPGVVRQVLLDRAEQAGVTIDVQPVFVADLELCEALVLTSTGRMATAAASVGTLDLDQDPAEELKALLSENPR